MSEPRQNWRSWRENRGVVNEMPAVAVCSYVIQKLGVVTKIYDCLEWTHLSSSAAVVCICPSYPSTSPVEATNPSSIS